MKQFCSGLLTFVHHCSKKDTDRTFFVPTKATLLRVGPIFERGRQVNASNGRRPCHFKVWLNFLDRSSPNVVIGLPEKQLVKCLKSAMLAWLKVYHRSAGGEINVIVEHVLVFDMAQHRSATAKSHLRIVQGIIKLLVFIWSAHDVRPREDV